MRRVAVDGLSVVARAFERGAVWPALKVRYELKSKASGSVVNELSVPVPADWVNYLKTNQITSTGYIDGAPVSTEGAAVENVSALAGGHDFDAAFEQHSWGSTYSGFA